ncbi:MAG: primosomal protein N', partial [Prevotella sp.]|nr:primosomal protein N' [Prevotella sp.]
MLYDVVILHVALRGLFTYAVPDGMSVGVGKRVLVTFGRSKSYLAVVARVHDVKPEGYTVKPIAQVMDAEPIVTDTQLKLWQWLSDYYLSPIGEVYKAALPAGLKAEDGYKPKTETFIRLTAAYRNVAALHVALNVLARARKQLEAFTAYLELSGWDQVEEGLESTEVTREELLNASHASADTLKQLEKRQILETYEVEVGRLNHGGDYRPDLIKPLSSAQQDAYTAGLMSFMKKNVTLLHGVTGSGKTELY